LPRDRLQQVPELAIDPGLVLSFPEARKARHSPLCFDLRPVEREAEQAERFLYGGCCGRVNRLKLGVEKVQQLQLRPALGLSKIRDGRYRTHDFVEAGMCEARVTPEQPLQPGRPGSHVAKHDHGAFDGQLKYLRLAPPQPLRELALPEKGRKLRVSKH